MSIIQDAYWYYKVSNSYRRLFKSFKDLECTEADFTAGRGGVSVGCFIL